MTPAFRDRVHAGRALALALERYRDRPDVVVLGLPRGGVPVAAEVASALGAPLDVFVVRKLGVPGHEEYAMGAIASGGVTVHNPDFADIDWQGSAAQRVITRESAELSRRETAYREQQEPLELEAKCVIVVDDGLATGSSMRAALMALRARRPARIVVGVPVAAPSTCREMQPLADEVICVATPEPFLAVGHWYGDFAQTSDAEVRALLRESRAPWRTRSA